MSAQPKICIVIAAYSSPPALESLVRSLDEQSLPQRDFEVFFVDDGSPDDTLERLRKIANKRPNYRVETMPNSGWPGAPRNLAIDATDADYVFFADHDDYFYPDALRRMTEFAAETGADIIHPKETVSGWSAPGWASWKHQGAGPMAWNLGDVQCITPHKLYRRAFLNEHSIRFPEGRIRLEDFSFNGDAWAHTDNVATLADTPVYKWIIYGGNSHQAGYDFDVYWDSFARSMKELPGISDETKRNVLLARWYRSRIIERLGPQFAGYSDEYRRKVYDRMRTFLPVFPEVVDQLLTPAERLRSRLLRQDRFDALLELAQLDGTIKLNARAVDVQWVGSALRVEALISLVDESGKEVRFRRTDTGTYLRDLPDRITADVPVADLDHAAALSDECEIAIRSKSDSVDWVVPARGSLEWEHTEGGLGSPRRRVHFDIDLGKAAFGSPLMPAVWEIFARWPGMGYTATYRIRGPRSLSRVALVNGQQAIAFSRRDGVLILDLGSNERTVFGGAGPRAVDVSVEAERRVVPLPDVHVHGKTEIQADLVTASQRRLPACLVGDGDGARLIVEDVTANLASSTLIASGRRSAVVFAGCRTPAVVNPQSVRPAAEVARTGAFSRRGCVAAARQLGQEIIEKLKGERRP